MTSMSEPSGGNFAGNQGPGWLTITFTSTYCREGWPWQNIEGRVCSLGSTMVFMVSLGPGKLKGVNGDNICSRSSRSAVARFGGCRRNVTDRAVDISG